MRHTTDLERRITDTGGNGFCKDICQLCWLVCLFNCRLHCSGKIIALVRLEHAILVCLRFSGRPVIDRFMMIRPNRTEMPGEGEKTHTSRLSL